MLVDELERCCSLTYRKEKEERERASERKLAFYSGIITLFDLFVPLNKPLAIECEHVLSVLSLSGNLEPWRTFKGLRHWRSLIYNFNQERWIDPIKATKAKLNTSEASTCAISSSFSWQLICASLVCLGYYCATTGYCVAQQVISKIFWTVQTLRV